MSSGIFCFFSTFLIYRKCFIKSKKQAHRRVPVNFVLNCRLLVSEKMNRRFSFLNNPQIIIIGAHFSCLLQINPNITVNFLLLNFDIICKCLCKEKDNPFANFTERTVFADFTKALFNHDIKTCFLFNFTDCCLMFVFTVFNMSLRKAPISAVAVLYKQNFRVLSAFVEDNRTARLFVKAHNAFQLNIFQF